MAVLAQQLVISRCPHCGVDSPTLESILSNPIETYNVEGANLRYWRVYRCVRCGSLVTAATRGHISSPVTEIYPAPILVDDAIPNIARAYLTQAINSINAPAGAVMLCASSVDAMLKEKGYVKGSLYARIDQANKDHLITDGMKEWAHEIRLDANDQRHADQNAILPSITDAQRVIKFTQAFGEFLFVLPARIERGKADALSSANKNL
ncbi:DUF4145 domain-containing protein [Microvirga sp. STR05]|uniref:DUF4145 domain-containing protein n=1 Tax=Hymenobacter duratus TaxID=2771356 RepID=A0ABR8JD66_9BACT|nr:DUF4145 domain-containing protein [Hymenobacter duratus]MBD2714743.1 DUF4145 domain-containing protein [Hymenobacter duratus]MBR7949648.1 DUF4145 domain-containing protein [Microvirga sp. STR05]